MEQQKLQQLQLQFLQLLNTGANLNQLCDVTASFCGVPVAITLPTRTIIAKSADYTEDLVNEFVSHMALASEAEIKERQALIERRLSSRQPIVDSYPYMRYKHMNCGCFRGASMLGVLDCPITQKVPLDEIAAVIAAAAPTFLAAMQLNSIIGPATSFPMQTYLAGLLHGDSSTWHQQQNIIGSPLSAIHSWQVIWCPPVGHAWAEQRKNDIALFCSRHNNAWSIEYEEGCVILTTEIPDAELNALAQQCGRLRPISVSDPFPSLKCVPDQLKRAQIALRLAEFETNTTPLIFVRTYKIPILFLAAAQNVSTKELVSPVLQQIKKYDESHASEYYATLQAYLLCSMEHAKMAQRLHIHKNTVIYRLQRISELFGLDLKDCRVLTDLYLSLFADFQP